MKIIETTSDLEIIQKDCVLTIGNFDGMHIGHQKILTTARQKATDRSVQLVGMTFEPHPVAILHPEKAPGVLTPLVIKEHLFAEFGLDCLIVLKDSYELLNLSPAGFVEQFLLKLQPSFVVEGEDFHFGAGRTGNVHSLHNFGLEKGFDVVVVESQEARLSIGQSVKISSTIIRNLLESAKAADAAIALGRPYRLIGKVVPGRGIGKRLGFPTANIQPAQQIIPAEGVYAGFVGIGENQHDVCALKGKIPAAFSIGRSTTFSGDYPLIAEAHLLIDNVDQLVGKWMAMDFVQNIRSQQKFKTQTDLAAQITKDCEKAKEILT